jgi:hypothetical protein
MVLGLCIGGGAFLLVLIAAIWADHQPSSGKSSITVDDVIDLTSGTGV